MLLSHIELMAPSEATPEVKLPSCSSWLTARSSLLVYAPQTTVSSVKLSRSLARSQILFYLESQ